MRTLPVSLYFFVATAIAFALQTVPILNIFLMFMLAMFWSALLINAGMIGTAWEALTGRVSRWWLVLPVAFYGGYLAFAVADAMALRQLGASYDAANARVAAPFDPQRQALVFESDRIEASWFVQNYRLPVSYSRAAGSPEGFRSNRLAAKEICRELNGNRTLGAAGIHSFGLYGDSKTTARFCNLVMPERPALPRVTVAWQEEKTRHAAFPITRTTTTVATPDGRRFQLLGGVAAPLGWIPIPIMGCWPATSKWKCEATFWRNEHTPIVAGSARYNRDSVTLARALGLKPVAIADRTGDDATLVRAKMAEIEKAALARQLAAIDRMISDPTGLVEHWQTEAVANRPEILAAKADAIMAGLERAAAVVGNDRWKARESGRILARLIAALPRDAFAPYGPRVIAIYRASCEHHSDSDRYRSHWLWEEDGLVRRMAEFGPQGNFRCGGPGGETPRTRHDNRT